MKSNLITALLFATAFAFTACADNKQESSTEIAEEKNEEKFEDNNTMGMGDSTAMNSEDDREFLVAAASGGLMEVELGKLAATNAASASVKDFGKKMMDEHSKANKALMSLAASKNISVPTTPGEKHQEHINDLKTKKGTDFDLAYMSLMVDDHQQDVDAYEKEAANGKDAEIKAFASGKVPVLKGHLEMAKTTRDKIK